MSSTNPNPKTITTALGGTDPATAYPPAKQDEGTVLVDTTSGNEFRCIHGATPTWNPEGGTFAFSQRTNLTGFQTTTLLTGAPLKAWIGYIGPQDLVDGTLFKLRAILANADGATTTTIRLRNLTTSTLVDIGGTGITILTVTSTTPGGVLSADLTAAAGFRAGNIDLYQLEVFTSNGSNAALIYSASLERTPAP